MENENPDAAEAFVFEWMNAKGTARVRQGHKGHRPVQNKSTDVCSWVYRLKRWNDRLVLGEVGLVSFSRGQRERGHR